MKTDITDLPATSPLFLSHLVDTYGGSIEIQQNSVSPKGNTFSSQKSVQTEGSRGAATTSLTHFINHKKPQKTTKMVTY